MAVVTLPVFASVNHRRESVMSSRDVQSPLERVSEGSESDCTPEAIAPKFSKARALRTLPTLDLMDRLDERDREVQELLLAGEAAIQSNTSDSARSSYSVDESPLGFQWDVPDFADVLSVVARGNEALQAKRGPTQDIVDCSPLKRTRSHGYEGISEGARGLSAMMAGMTQRLAMLSDPQYLDDLLALQASESSQAEAQGSTRADEGSMTEVEALRKENRRLQESLAESTREKAEMSKVLLVLEGRLATSNEFLKNACSAEETKPKSTLRCGSALLSLKAQQWPRACVSGMN